MKRPKNIKPVVSEETIFSFPYSREKSPELFYPIRLSSRMTTESKSLRASCNVFVVEDSMPSIGASFDWANQVSAYQGAPSLYAGNLRPVNSPVSSGGTAAGLVAYLKAMDAILSFTRRADKKNSAGLVSCDWKHPEVLDFIQTPTQTAFTAVYVPNNEDPKQADDLRLFNESETKKRLFEAYNSGITFFIVKTPTNPLLRVNLCTEVEIPHKGTCQLADINLSQFDWEDLKAGKLTETFDKLTRYMEARFKSIMTEENRHIVSLDGLNLQYGIGVLGLASMLAHLNITYQQLADAFTELFSDGIDNITDLKVEAFTRQHNDNKAFALVGYLAEAYELASKISTVDRAFCVKPTVTAAKTLPDKLGYCVSPEIAPVVASVKTGKTVNYLEKSAINGDYYAQYPVNIQTQEDVPLDVYLKVADGWQKLMQSTGKTHRHSFSPYGYLTLSQFDYWLNSSIKSLYYRLPEQSAASQDKANSVGVQFSFDVDSLLMSCQKDQPSCQVCTG